MKWRVKMMDGNKWEVMRGLMKVRVSNYRIRKER